MKKDRLLAHAVFGDLDAEAPRSAVDGQGLLEEIDMFKRQSLAAVPASQKKPVTTTTGSGWKDRCGLPRRVRFASRRSGGDGRSGAG